MLRIATILLTITMLSGVATASTDDEQGALDEEEQIAQFLAGLKVKVGDVAPDWTLDNPQGNPIGFYSDSDGRPSLILFWATWCPRCKEVMPVLQGIQDSLPPDSANFFALHAFDDEGDPVAYFEEHEYSFTLLLDADDVAEDYGAPGTPWILLVDADNVVQYIPFGAASMEEAVSKMEAVLQGKQ